MGNVIEKDLAEKKILLERLKGSRKEKALKVQMNKQQYTTTWISKGCTRLHLTRTDRTDDTRS